MSRYTGIAILVVVVLGLFVGSGVADAQHRLGGGIHYLHNLGELEDTGTANLDWSQDSFSLMGSYQYSGMLVKVEGDVEYIFDYVGTGEAMWEPSAWALLGSLLYGGAGIGIGYTDGDWQSNPFFALRAGVDVALGGMDLDVFASYRFQSDQQIENLTGEDLDSLTFAALLRFGVGGHR